MLTSYAEKTVLVTGGTRGIGLATALAFGKLGASTVLTYRWGAADLDEVAKKFEDVGAKAPLIVRADAADAKDTPALLQAIRSRHDAVDVFVSNVAGAVVAGDFMEMTERALLKTMSYTAWPTFAYLQALRATFGRFPRYVVATSSPGPDRYSPGYDFVAASKAVLETLVRYTSYRLRDDNVNVNVVRVGALDTQSAREMFGADLFGFLARRAPPGFRWLTAEDVANVVLALCSGWLDGVQGQTLTVDRGVLFGDNAMRLYSQRGELGL